MIMFLMLILLAVPFVAGIESLFAGTEHVRARAALAGIGAGGLAWNAYTYWAAFPPVSIVLLVLAAVVLVRLLIRGGRGAAKGLVVAVVSLALLSVAWQGLLISWANAEVVSEIETLNAEGEEGTALLVYHPGRSGFPQAVNLAFADGLAAAGWRVDVTTASAEAPTDLSGYDLLVLGAPTYDWKPARRIQIYLDGLGDLQGQPTAVIIAGAGYTPVSIAAMEELVREANGQLVDSLELWTVAPSFEDGQMVEPVELARKAGRSISLPPE